MSTLAALSAWFHSPISSHNAAIAIPLALACGIAGYWSIRRMARPR